MGILGFFFMFVLALLFVVLMIGLTIIGKLFGGIDKALSFVRDFFWGKARKGTQSGNGRQQDTYGSRMYNDDDDDASASQRPHTQNGKMFDNGEGTYVDFEEMK